MKLLGKAATAFTIFKGFVASSILYMPKNFINGGYGFSAIALILSLFLTLYCVKLLLDTRKKLGGKMSFSEIGEHTWGRTGKILVDVALCASQISFVTAYVYFIVKNLQLIIKEAQTKSDGEEHDVINKWLLGIVCFIIYVPLCMIRKVETLAATHLFGDIMIIITLVVIFVYAGIHVGNHGF